MVRHIGGMRRAVAGLALAGLLVPAIAAGQETVSEIVVTNVTKSTRVSFSGAFYHKGIDAPKLNASVEIPNLGSRLVVIAVKQVSRNEVSFSGRIDFSAYIEQQPARPIDAKLVLSTSSVGEFSPIRLSR
jgi:hypothetical protein